MAIKVQGTDVIDDSRSLRNITSIDSTTENTLSTTLDNTLISQVNAGTGLSGGGSSGSVTLNGVTQPTSDWEAGTSTTESLVSPAKIRDAIPPALNASGSAPIYACRAWVSFSATGAIRGSGNVSSVTDNGSGDYTINFSVILPNGDYVVGGTSIWGSLQGPCNLALASLASKTTSSCRVYFLDDESGSRDPVEGFVSFIG